MTGPAQYRIGAETECTDGSKGRLAWVVVDPVAGTLTHLVVEPDRGVRLGRLVPVDLVADPGPPVRLGCDGAALDAMEAAEETRFVPGSGGFGYGAGQVLAWPYFGLGTGGIGTVGAGLGPAPIVYDKVPLGEVEVRRGDPVRARDGDIGSVQGLVIDPADRHVTHVLLKEGHLWGRKQVAIPVSAVRAGDDGGIEVALTKDEIKELPPIDLAGH